MADSHDIVLALHVAAGALGLVLGPLTILAERTRPHRSRAGLAYHWSVLGVAVTAVGLVAFDPSRLWWLAPLAALSYGLALLGVVASRRHGDRWVRLHARGQGGSYIALVTALLVVSLDGPVGIAAWILPSLVGHRLVERRVARLSAREGAGRAGPSPAPRPSPAPLPSPRSSPKP